MTTIKAVGAKRAAANLPMLKSTTFSFSELEEIWVKADGPEEDKSTAAAIALAESKGDPSAEDRDSNGTVDRGLWQINSVHGALSTFDIEDNAKAAVQIAKESGFGAWVTYKNGAAGNILSEQGKTLTPTEIANLPKEPGVEPGTKEAVEGSLTAVIPGSELFGNLFSWSKLSEFGINMVLLLAGAVLLVYGVMVAVRPREGALSLPKLPVPVPV